MPPHCWVRGCTATAEDGSRTLYRFPKDDSLKREWLKVCGMGEGDFKSTARICEGHFSRAAFVLRDRLLRGPKKRLKRDAVPSVRLAIAKTAQATQTVQADMTQPLERARLEKISAELKRRSDTLEKELEKIFTPGQMKKILYPNMKCNWTGEDMSAAASLYARGSGAYDHMYQKGYPLPHLTTIRKFQKTIKKSP